jgi:hypothetical protein
MSKIVCSHCGKTIVMPLEEGIHKEDCWYCCEYCALFHEEYEEETED